MFHECARRTVEQDTEMMRLQLLGNPDLMRQIQEARSFPTILITSSTKFLLAH
jgi:hypothetical protein